MLHCLVDTPLVVAVNAYEFRDQLKGKKFKYCPGGASKAIAPKSWILLTKTEVEARKTARSLRKELGLTNKVSEGFKDGRNG